MYFKWCFISETNVFNDFYIFLVNRSEVDRALASAAPARSFATNILTKWSSNENGQTSSSGKSSFAIRSISNFIQWTYWFQWMSVILCRKLLSSDRCSSTAEALKCLKILAEIRWCRCHPMLYFVIIISNYVNFRYLNYLLSNYVNNFRIRYVDWLDFSFPPNQIIWRNRTFLEQK